MAVDEVTQSIFADLGPWAEFAMTLNKLWPVWDEAIPDFEGLLAVLSGKRICTGPPKLCIDGHEYHRRQRRRVKRKR